MIFLILLFGLLLRLIGINQSFWLDEAAQAVMSNGSFAGAIFRPGDFHPPLFYILTYFWLKISHAEIFLRLLPLIFGILTIYSLYYFAKRHFNEKIALAAAFLLSISPFHIYYSQEFRGYSLLILLSLISAFLFFEKKWRIYSLVNILGFFTNYMYVFVILAEVLWLILFEKGKNFKKMLVVQIPLFLLFLLWLPQFLAQLQTGRTLLATQPEWRNLSSSNFIVAIPLIIFKFIAGKIAVDKNVFFVFYATLMVLIVCYVILRLAKRKDKMTGFLMFLIWVPLFASWLVSFFVPLDNPPRLIFILPFLFLSIADYIYLFKDRHLIYIFFVISIFGIFMQNYMPVNEREDWKNAIKFIDDNSISKKKTIAVFEFIAPFAPWQWYEKNGIDAVGAVPTKANEKDLNVFLGPTLIGKNRVYLFEYFADVTDPNRLVRKYLEVRQFRVTNFYTFNNLGFVYEMRRPYLSPMKL